MSSFWEDLTNQDLVNILVWRGVHVGRSAHARMHDDCTEVGAHTAGSCDGGCERWLEGSCDHGDCDATLCRGDNTATCRDCNGDRNGDCDGVCDTSCDDGRLRLAASPAASPHTCGSTAHLWGDEARFSPCVRARGTKRARAQRERGFVLHVHFAYGFVAHTVGAYVF